MRKESLKGTQQVRGAHGTGDERGIGDGPTHRSKSQGPGPWIGKDGGWGSKGRGDDASTTNVNNAMAKRERVQEKANIT